MGACGAHPRKKCRSKSASERLRRSLASAVVVPDRTATTTTPPPPPHRDCVSLAGTDPDTVLGSVAPSASGVLRNSSSDCHRLGNSQSTVATRGFAEQGVCDLLFEPATRRSTVGTQVAPSLPAGRAPVARPALPVDSLASGDHVVCSRVRSRCGCGAGADAVVVRSGTTTADASARSRVVPPRSRRGSPVRASLALFDRAFFSGRLPAAVSR